MKAKTHSKGWQFNTSAAAYSRFNSRMGMVYNVPARDVAVLERVYIPNKRRKGHWGLKVVGFTMQSGFDHADCMVKEQAHKAKGLKRGFTWRAAQ